MDEAMELLLPVKKDNLKNIGILGTGDYARALAKRFLLSGYKVIMGSRVPSRRCLTAFDNCLCGVQLTTLEECIKSCDVIVAAIHMENFKDTLEPLAVALTDKVVIDVSNRTNRYSAVSNAEYLQSLLPKSIVVKAFNSVSAYALENQTFYGSNRAFVASDELVARERVLSLARDLGFSPCDMGGLRAARSMEAFVLKVFPGWKVPLFITFCIFNLWALFCVYLYFIESAAYRWDQVFLKVFNKPLCMTAITILSITYLPGSLAGIIQLWRGTKYSRFPRWFSAWLIARRQLGLIALTLVFMHALASAIMLSPTYYSSWFQKMVVLVPTNLTGMQSLQVQPAWMVWKGEVACLLGILSLVLLAVVGIASLPSVAASLNWAEWRFLQSKLGVLALFLALGHVVAMGAPGWITLRGLQILKSITFLAALLPTLTLLLRFVLAIPPFHSHLKRIRKGWERNRNRLPFSASSCSTSTTGSTSSSGSCSSSSSCCGSGRKGGILKSYAARPIPAPKFSRNSIYKPIQSEAEKDCCSSCQVKNSSVVLPTPECDCSIV